MLDYKDIIIKRYALGMSGREIARLKNVSKSGVNEFLRSFEQCERICYPLPEGITNYGIAELVYGKVPGTNVRNENYVLPVFEEIAKQMSSRKNMTLFYLWSQYAKQCKTDGLHFYQYRQYCSLYSSWCEENYETLHLNSVSAQKMEVDFAGHTFRLEDKITGEVSDIVVFVAVLPYSQYVYAEGMSSTKEPMWIDVNNNALAYFDGVPAIVVCDNCKQAVIANRDWIQPELNKDYAEWADHNHTVILPAKVRKPKFKSSVENTVGILEKGLFHDLEERTYFSLAEFNEELHKRIKQLNLAPFKKREHNRQYYWEEEKRELMPLPSMQYQYMERTTAKVSSDFHIRFDNAYYSVDKAFLHKKVLIKASTAVVRIYALSGEFIYEWPRATREHQWLTNPKHLPSGYNGYAEWNGAYFINKAMVVGPNTVEVIKRILVSRKYEAQTYRLCLGVLKFTKKYGNPTLEECCKQALRLNKFSYTFIKNTIPAIAGDITSKNNNERNKGGYVMTSTAADVNKLLSKSQKLVKQIWKEAKK